MKSSPGLSLDYIAAPPRMTYYIDYSTQIYNIYLKYIAPEDIHVYSIDEVFLDATDYLNTYNLSARELTTKITSIGKKGVKIDFEVVICLDWINPKIK